MTKVTRATRATRAMATMGSAGRGAGRGGRLMRPLRVLGYGAAAATLGGGALVVGALAEARAPIQRGVSVPVLRSGLGDLRVLQISDVHMWRGSRWEVRWIQSLVDLEPDLVILTGDNLCEAQGLPLLQRALQPLAGIPGAFVFGSNDYYSGTFSLPFRYAGPATRNAAKRLLSLGRGLGDASGTDSSSAAEGAGGAHADAAPRKPKRTTPDLPHRELAAFLTEQLGWADLRNGGAVLQVPLHRPGRVDEVRQTTLTVSLTGVDDPHINYDAPVYPGPDWQRADVRIGVTHAPYARVLDAMTAAGADLIVAGHTHGGQICLPVGRALVNNSDAPLWASGGLHRWQRGCVASPKPNTYRGSLRPLPTYPADAPDSTWLHVSRGLGTSKYTPIRLFCRPETTLVTLTRRTHS